MLLTPPQSPHPKFEENLTALAGSTVVAVVHFSTPTTNALYSLLSLFLSLSLSLSLSACLSLVTQGFLIWRTVRDTGNVDFREEIAEVKWKETHRSQVFESSLVYSFFLECDMTTLDDILDDAMIDVALKFGELSAIIATLLTQA